MSLPVLVHSFSQYSFLWEGFVDHWERNSGLLDTETFFGTDVSCEKDEILTKSGLQVLYSGRGEWSDRLTRLLLQIPSDYILYMQEDHYPEASAPQLDQLLQIIREYDLSRLQIAPVNQFYSLYGAGIPLFFHEKSKYLVSHQPSIWKKSFLLECLKPGESPWTNEYEGTKRLNSRSDIRGKIAIYPCDWFSHRCVKGNPVQKVIQ